MTTSAGKFQSVHLTGACHCRNISFDLVWPRKAMKSRRCSCTFFRKHSASWSSDADCRLSINVANESRLSKYVFGTDTAEFFVCSLCGVVPVAVSEIDSQHFAVFNVETIDNLEGIEVSEMATNFDTEDTDGRLERRKRSWVNDVQFG